MSHCLTPTKVAPLAADQAAMLMRDGYLLLRGAVPEAWREALRAAFDAGVGTGDQWAVPRGIGWRHALVDLDPTVQLTCRLPPLLAAAAGMLAGPFFLAQVEGREPLRDGGHQPLHRDGVGTKPSPPWSSSTLTGRTTAPRASCRAISTRALSTKGLVDPAEPDEASSLIIAGEAGDILVFDADLPHGATRNRSGARRRSLLLSFMPERMRAAQESCRALRNVRMDTSEVFVP